MKIKIILVLIILLASIIRLWNLTNYPSGFNADEAAIGYNAYSLLQTGKDEYGQSFPVAFKSFGDYKPGLYFYFVMPFVASLGLTELAVRLPSALLGIGTVILVYFLAKELFKKAEIGLIASLLLATTPWHIHFSRGGWETNTATFFITLGVYLFLIGLEKPKYIFWSLLSFLVSMYLYQSPRLIIPVFGLGLLILYKDYFLNHYKKFLWYLPILVLLAIPLVLQFTGGGGSARFSGLSFLSDTGPGLRTNELRGEHSNMNGWFTILIHNKVTTIVPQFIGHYVDHFRPDFLFIRGDEVIRDKAPETGQFFLIESVLLIVGIAFLIVKPVKDNKLLLLWVLTAPLASAMTFQTPNALRSLSLVIPLVLIMAYGMYWMIKDSKNVLRYCLVFMISLFLIFETAHFLESYFIHYPKRTPLAWEYGFSEMVRLLGVHENQFDKVVITDRYDQPYILVLFYKKYNPAKYQPQAVLTERDKFNFGTVRSFDNYQFRKIEKDEKTDNVRTLYIGTKEEVPDKVQIIDKVNFPNGEPAFIFYQRI